MKYAVQTFFDITATGITGHFKPSRIPFRDNVGNIITNEASWNRARNQQRNWETVTQVLSLRAQLLELEYLGVVDEDLELYSFGVDYTGIHKVWAFEFAVDRDNVYSFDCDRYGTLKDDFKIAPIITGLTETISLTRPLFEVAGPSKNIYFKSLD